jgi:hypothetical protein
MLHFLSGHTDINGMMKWNVGCYHRRKSWLTETFSGYQQILPLGDRKCILTFADYPIVEKRDEMLHLPLFA